MLHLERYLEELLWLKGYHTTLRKRMRLRLIRTLIFLRISDETIIHHIFYHFNRAIRIPNIGWDYGDSLLNDRPADAGRFKAWG